MNSVLITLSVNEPQKAGFIVETVLNSCWNEGNFFLLFLFVFLFRSLVTWFGIFWDSLFLHAFFFF